MHIALCIETGLAIPNITTDKSGKYKSEHWSRYIGLLLQLILTRLGHVSLPLGLVLNRTFTFSVTGNSPTPKTCREVDTDKPGCTASYLESLLNPSFSCASIALNPNLPSRPYNQLGSVTTPPLFKHNLGHPSLHQVLPQLNINPLIDIFSSFRHPGATFIFNNNIRI